MIAWYAIHKITCSLFLECTYENTAEEIKQAPCSGDKHYYKIRNIQRKVSF